MRPSAVVLATFATLALSAAPALAQGAPSALSRTLTVPRAPGSAPTVHPRAQPATTRELDFPLREPRLTAEDGARHPFTRVMDGSEDVKVRVQRGECPPPERPEEPATRFLLRQPVERLRQVAFHVLEQSDSFGAVTVQVAGTLPLAPHALLLLTVEDDAKTFVPGEVHLSGPTGPLRVLGQGTLDSTGRFSVIVERPEGATDGTRYTLTLTEKNGARRIVIKDVTPWPLAPPSPQGVEVLGQQERPEGDPGDARHRKVLGTQRLEPR